MTGTVLSSHQDFTAKDLGIAAPDKWRFIDWIWHVRGDVALAPEQSGEEAFDRLAPLFDQTGTTYERQKDALTFRKKDPAAQDKMSVFDSGILRVETAGSGPVLRYDLTSRALLYCFLAPLLFLAFAQAIITLNAFHKPPAHAASLSGKAKVAVHKPAAKEAVVPMNPIDKALGAPAPEKAEDEGSDEDGPKSKKPSPTAAYVFACFFVALYIIGRILEDRLIRNVFRRSLGGS